MSRAGHDAAMIEVLVWRDLVHFVRQRSRIFGALAPPLLLWAAIGAGVTPSFRVADGTVSYLQYFYPGILLVLLLQVSVSATMSVIEDRRQGFLQGVLVAPGSRAALAVGKSLGSAAVGVLHAAIFLILSPVAGFRLTSIRWIPLFSVLGLTALAMSAAGFALAWWLDSIQAYHVVMGIVLFPLWILSGAFFPAEGQQAIMRALVVWNPLSWALAGTRRAMYGGALPAGVGLPGAGALAELLVVGATAAVFLVLATAVCARRRSS